MPFVLNPFTRQLDFYESGGGGSGVTSVTGTTNRITSTGGTTPQIDIAANYAGQASITTVGTIGTGTWNATAIGPTVGGTGQTSYATGDILYASGANTLGKLTASTVLGSQLAISSVGLPVWNQAVGGPDIIDEYDELLYQASSNIETHGIFGLSWSSNGTGSSTGVTNSIATNPGLVLCATGTTTTGSAGITNCNNFSNMILLGGGPSEFRFRYQIPVLSNGTDTFTVYAGLSEAGGAFATYPGNNALWFVYNSAVSGNWSAQTIGSGSSTTASGGSSVAVGTGFTNFRISVNAAASSVSFFVGNTLIGTSTTTIPTSQSLGWSFQIIKSAGTTSRTLVLDRISLFNQLTTSRI